MIFRPNAGALLLLLALGGCARHAEPYRYPPERLYPIEPAGGCTDSVTRVLPPSRVSDTLSLEATYRFPDRLNAWRARRVPGGWAGGPSPSAGNGPSLLWLRDTTRTKAALAALDSLTPFRAGSFPPISRDSVVAVAVRWDLADLFDWMEYLRTDARPRNGAGYNSWGLDGRNSRIILGIEKLETLPALTQWLRDISMPCHLIVVRIAGPISTR